jgi:transmembrane sensor
MTIEGSTPRGLSRREEAAHWYVRNDMGELPAGEAREFNAWMEDPQNAAAYRKAQSGLDALEGGNDDAHVEALRRAALAFEGRRGFRHWRAAAGIAAAALVATVVAGVMTFSSSRDVDNRVVENAAPPVSARLDALGAADFVTAPGERLKVELPDGSIVTVNTDTAIDVAYSPGERVVLLKQGQAFFEVARDAARPFVVRVADRKVTAVGTAFDVELSPRRFQVVLVEGKVKVDPAPSRSGGSNTPAPEIVLTPGYALVAALGVAEQVVELNVERELRWREGYVEFENEPLGSAVAEMNRYFAEPVILHDPRVAELRVSGVFRTAQRDEFLSIVTAAFPVRVERKTGQQVELAWSDAPSP